MVVGLRAVGTIWLLLRFPSCNSEWFINGEPLINNFVAIQSNWIEIKSVNWIEKYLI